jgi:hypothetical protein
MVVLGFSGDVDDSISAVVNSDVVVEVPSSIVIISTVVVGDSTVVVRLCGDIVCCGIVLVNSNMITEVSEEILVISRAVA